MHMENYKIESINSEEKIDIIDLQKEVLKTSQWVGDNIEDAEIATIIITWLQKMMNQLIDNIEKLEKLKKEEKKNQIDRKSRN